MRNMSPKGIEATDQGAIRMDRATLGIEKYAAPLCIPGQVCPFFGRISIYKIRCRQPTISGQAGDFVWIDLDLLVMAAGKTTLA